MPSPWQKERLSRDGKLPTIWLIGLQEILKLFITLKSYQEIPFLLIGVFPRYFVDDGPDLSTIP